MPKPYHVEYWYDLQWILVDKCADYTSACIRMQLEGAARKGLYRIINVYDEKTFS